MRPVEVPTDDRFEAALPLAAVVDEFLATQRAEISAWVGSYGDDRRELTFHLSGGGCLRREVLRKERAPETPTTGVSARRFAIGNIVEAMLDKAMEWKGISVAKQTRVWMDWAFRAGHGHRWTIVEGEPGQRQHLDLSECLAVGKLDHIVEWQGRRYLLDWKTCHSGKFYWLDKGYIDDSYALQLAGYWNLYERQFGEKIDEARLVFAEKDTLRLKQICVPREPWVTKSWDRWKAQRAAWEARQEQGALPPELAFRDENGSRSPSWLCDPRYCGFADAKWPDGSFICPTVAKYWEEHLTERAGGHKSRNGREANGSTKVVVQAPTVLGESPTTNGKP